MLRKPIEDLVDVLANEPSLVFLIVVGTRVPNHGPLKHSDSPVQVSCEDGHMRVRKDAEKLLAGALSTPLGLNTLVNICASA